MGSVEQDSVFGDSRYGLSKTPVGLTALDEGWLVYTGLRPVLLPVGLSGRTVSGRCDGKGRSPEG